MGSSAIVEQFLEAELILVIATRSVGGTVEPRYNDTNFSAIFLRYTEVSFNQGSRASIINKEGPP